MTLTQRLQDILKRCDCSSIWYLSLQKSNLGFLFLFFNISEAKKPDCFFLP